MIKETAYRESRDVLTISPEWFDAGDIPTFDIRYRALAGIMNLLDLPKLTTATEAVLLRTLVTKIYDYEPDTYSTIENSYALVILLAEQPWETAKRMKSLSSKDRNTLRRIMSDAQKGLEMYNPTIGKVLSELSSTMHQGMIRK